MALAYLGGTFATFLFFGRSADAPDLFLLCTFIGLTLIAFAFGYRLEVARSTRNPLPVVVPDDRAAPHSLIFCCASYYLLISAVYLTHTGLSDVASLWRAVTNPGEAYFAKLHPQTEMTYSPVTQGVAVFSVLYLLLVPLAVQHWKNLSWALRIYVIIAVCSYLVFFLSIGTQKGLGETLIFWAAAYSAVRASSHRRGVRRWAGRRILSAVLMATFIGGFLWYMTFAQTARLEERDLTAKFPGNPAVAAMFGPDFAAGVAVTIDYPTHGYLGLSYNLEQPFVWTYGIGSMPAVADYARQYLGIDAPLLDRYTARTEAATGWPDGMYWSTIYPWLASDLTFPGAVMIMMLLGWFTSKFWREAREGRTLSLAMFCQLALILVYVPANNQIGQNRPALFGFLSLAVLSLNDRLRNRRGEAIRSGG